MYVWVVCFFLNMKWQLDFSGSVLYFLARGKKVKMALVKVLSITLQCYLITLQFYVSHQWRVLTHDLLYKIHMDWEYCTSITEDYSNSFSWRRTISIVTKVCKLATWLDSKLLADRQVTVKGKAAFSPNLHLMRQVTVLWNAELVALTHAFDIFRRATAQFHYETNGCRILQLICWMECHTEYIRLMFQLPGEIQCISFNC